MANSSIVIKAGGTLTGVTQVAMGQNVRNLGAVVPIDSGTDTGTVQSFDYLDIIARPHYVPTRAQSVLYFTYNQPGSYHGGGADFVRLTRTGRWIYSGGSNFISASLLDEGSVTINTEVINQSVILTGKRVRVQ